MYVPSGDRLDSPYHPSFTMRKYHALGAAAGAAAAAVLSGLFIMRRNRRRPSPSLVHERGQVVVITGGSRGLGHELAQLYIAADARVAILDIKDEDEDGACASSTRYYKCDVSNSEDVEMTLNRVESEVSGMKGRMEQVRDYFPVADVH